MPFTKITYEDTDGNVKYIKSDDSDQIISYLNEKYPEGYRILTIEYGTEEED